MSSTCSDPAFSTNAPAFVRHGSLRPASRDLSGGARSGNANQTTFEPGRTRIQRQPIRQDFLSPPDPRSIPGRLGREWISNGSGLEHDRSLRSHLEASRQNLLFTMYQNRRRAEAMRNLHFSSKDNVFPAASRSRRLLRKRLTRQRRVRLRGTTWWSLSGSNRRPPACKAGALPAELKPQLILLRKIDVAPTAICRRQMRQAPAAKQQPVHDLNHLSQGSQRFCCAKKLAASLIFAAQS